MYPLIHVIDRSLARSIEPPIYRSIFELLAAFFCVCCTASVCVFLRRGCVCPSLSFSLSLPFSNPSWDEEPPRGSGNETWRPSTTCLARALVASFLFSVVIPSVVGSNVGAFCLSRGWCGPPLVCCAAQGACVRLGNLMFHVSRDIVMKLASTIYVMIP